MGFQSMATAIRPAIPLLFAVLLTVPTWNSAVGQSKIEPEADRAVRAMSAYLTSLPSFSADYDVDMEHITREGEKLQFSASGKIEVSRPDKLRLVRHGGFADVEMFFDGKKITVLGTHANVYGEIEAKGTLSNAVDALRSELGLELPGSDLLLPQVYDHLMVETQSGAYWGTTYVGGVECDYLAFRGMEVDWQIWISKGEKPLPMKLVITSKWISGSPQYSLRLANWNTNASLPAGHFDFKAPAGSRKLDEVTAEMVGESNSRMGR